MRTYAKLVLMLVVVAIVTLAVGACAGDPLSPDKAAQQRVAAPTSTRYSVFMDDTTTCVKWDYSSLRCCNKQGCYIVSGH